MFTAGRKWSQTVVVKKGAESEGKAFNLPLQLHSTFYLWSWAAATDWNYLDCGHLWRVSGLSIRDVLIYRKHFAHAVLWNTARMWRCPQNYGGHHQQCKHQLLSPHCLLYDSNLQPGLWLCLLEWLKILCVLATMAPQPSPVLQLILLFKETVQVYISISLALATLACF